MSSSEEQSCWWICFKISGWIVHNMATPRFQLIQAYLRHRYFYAMSQAGDQNKKECFQLILRKKPLTGNYALSSVFLLPAWSTFLYRHRIAYPHFWKQLHDQNLHAFYRGQVSCHSKLKVLRFTNSHNHAVVPVWGIPELERLCHLNPTHQGKI